MKHLAYLGLGTNLGDRMMNLRQALEQLEPLAHVVKVSKVYETPPWGYLDQPAFLNQVAEIETQLSPQALFELTKGIEGQMGRVKSILNGPRLIDLDILFYDDLIVDLPGLKIPHPRMEGRGFVLLPLAELAPGFIHPQLNKSILEMSAGVDRTGIREYL
jgi:2-amino-4-hydroxy-6-hydroxymethyldihydropteridine diphosphokinase